MDAIEDRYREIYADFDALITHGIAVSSAIAGKTTNNDRYLYAAPVFNKLLCHAVTLKRISPTGMTPITPRTSELWDLSSACALARAIIEAYDALAYVAVHDVDEGERRFRILMWELHDQERRQKMLRLIGSSAPGVAEINENVLRLRTQLQAHPLFANAEKDLRSKVQGENAPAFHLSHSQRNQRSGVNHEYYNAAVMFLSSYVHTFPFSVHQLMQFRAGDPESLRLMSLPMRYATGFLAKGIEGVSAVFGEAIPPPSDRARTVLDTWLGIVSCGVRNAGYAA